MKSIRKMVAAGLVGGALVLTSACGGGDGGGNGSAAKAELGAGGAAGDHLGGVRALGEDGGQRGGGVDLADAGE
ncbi:hypothetical protein AB0N76_09525, partial [Kitasatospora sp. NPDC093806]